MGTYHRHGVESTAAVFRHPIHPMLIPFPIASLIGALVTDIAFRVTNNVFWADVSFWLLLAGIVTGAVTAIPGMLPPSTGCAASQALGSMPAAMSLPCPLPSST
ncbi:DUF2231 domain-containing protein [Microvirga sp. BSC39]|uniref:DUF2231 domain-containing protein n=1 Tax=Microvirga sp. BSC39 TaxID=1549810 RepID=UPI0026D94E09